MSQLLRSKIILFLYVVLVCNIAMAQERMIIPQWNSYKSDFREATIHNGILTDSYNKQDSDTVNVIDIETTEKYKLSISISLTNLHNNPYSHYSTYYHNSEGKVKRGKSVQKPIYGWVIGMKDMHNYNAVLLRPSGNSDILYSHSEIELRIISVNNGDTIYHTPWRKCVYDNLNSNSDTYTLCIQYNKNRLIVGSSWNIDMPLISAQNINMYGNMTGLYLGAGAKVCVEDAMILVEPQDSPTQTEWNKERLQNYFANQQTSSIEGFWEIIYGSRRKDGIKMGGDYKLAIVAHDNHYDIIYLSGAKINPKRWREGMLKGRLIPNNSERYKVEWYDAEQEKLDNILAFSYGNDIKIQFINENTIIYLTQSTDMIKPTTPTIDLDLGSGFALTHKGYIATNNHVIKGHKKITIGQMHNYPHVNSYNAEVVARDTINDIAILRINDNNFTSWDNIPYTISQQEVRRGDEIFYLGYPVPDILSSEIKTSDGKVTALYGYKKSQYMMSVNIDQGSSGSPVFDQDGNVVGIVVSGFSKETTNIEANYAIRTSYLIDLMKSIDGIGDLPENKIKVLSHPDKIEAIAPYVFFIVAGD